MGEGLFFVLEETRPLSPAVGSEVLRAGRRSGRWAGPLGPEAPKSSGGLNVAGSSAWASPLNHHEHGSWYLPCQLSYVFTAPVSVP
jgi:hypothetical protein